LTCLCVDVKEDVEDEEDPEANGCDGDDENEEEGMDCDDGESTEDEGNDDLNELTPAAKKNYSRIIRLEDSDEEGETNKGILLEIFKKVYSL